MVLESKFRIAADVTIEKHEGQIYLFLKSKPTQAPVKFPLQMQEAIERLRADFVPGALMEALITNGADADQLIIRYFYLESLKKGGFLCERICGTDADLIEALPSRFGERVSLSNSTKCKLSRFAYLHQVDDALVLESPITEHQDSLHRRSAGSTGRPSFEGNVGRGDCGTTFRFRRGNNSGAC